MQFLANSFDELKTQQRLALSDLHERLIRLEQQLQRLQPQASRWVLLGAFKLKGLSSSGSVLARSAPLLTRESLSIELDEENGSQGDEA
jgi:hypothetical protein